MTKHDLVIGQAAGYSYRQVEPFLRTLRRSGFAGDIAWFVLESDHQLRQQLEHHGVIVVPYENQYPYFVDHSHYVDLPIEDDGRNWHPATLRFFLYEAWLNRHGSHYKRVLHADTRDVIFQCNPFSEPWPTGVHIFQEHPRLCIGNEPSNRAWIQACFGNDVLQQIASKPIACSGVILGSNPQWQRFLKDYNSIMNSSSFTGNSVDQATLNRLVNLKDAKEALNLKVWDDDEWITSTESYFKPTKSLHWNPSARLVTGGRDVIPIVHQYDRNALLSLIWNRPIFLGSMRKKPWQTTRNLAVNLVWWIVSSARNL